MGSTKLKRGDKLWGLDLGTWRMVEVLEPGTGNGVKIHWIGWSDSWDQVLTFDKLRIPEGAAVAAKTPDAAAPSKDPVTPSEPTTPGKTEKPAGVEVRTWSDFTGKFKIEAEFVSFDKGMVVLKKADGTTTTISIARLSPADQQYVFERMTSKP